MALRPDLYARVRSYIAVSEGESLHKYLDSKSIPTIANGFNLQRDDARMQLRSIGADPDVIMNATACTKGPPHSAARCGIADQIAHAQSLALLDRVLEPLIQDAAVTVDNFEQLSDARKFVIIDLCYNLGIEQWDAFGPTRALISSGDFAGAADHLAASLWYQQTGNRAKRDVAIMRSGEWLPASYSEG